MTLLDKLESRTATVGVFGLGYVGLSMAMEFARVGYRVLGIDTDATKISRLCQGMSDVQDVASSDVRRALDSGLFVPTTDSSLVPDMDAIVICVPTPWRAKPQDPDLSFILDVTSTILDSLRRDQLVVLESTSFPGTTADVVLPILEKSGLRVGTDFYLAFSPERIDPGNDAFPVRSIPKLVGGITPDCLRHAVTLYAACLDRVVPVSSAVIAEMSKLLENTFRSVNIALANEVALLCSKLGIDVWEVIDAAATKPFGFMPFYPGPGLGGHCIPVDPLYLSWAAKVNGFYPKLVDMAVKVNQEMPGHVLRRVRESLEPMGLNGADVLVAGVTYKRNTADVRESPAVEIIQGLQAEGARVRITDPHIDSLTVGENTLPSYELTARLVEESDCVLILTDHSALDFELVARHAVRIVDTRNALPRAASNGSRPEPAAAVRS